MAQSRTQKSTAAVAKQATEPGVIALHKMILIGVFGAEDAKSALVRMSSGKMRKVEVGDRLNWGRVTAIGADRLLFQRNGKTVVLQMPAG